MGELEDQSPMISESGGWRFSACTLKSDVYHVFIVFNNVWPYISFLQWVHVHACMVAMSSMSMTMTITKKSCFQLNFLVEIIYIIS